MAKKLTTGEFIEKSKKAHGDKYDYSEVRYVNSGTSVTIICPDHGPFDQRPADHQRGVGCNECGILKKTGSGNGRASDLKKFISAAKLKHGDTYSYDKSIYHNSRTKVIITCRTHGDFEQNPRHHIRGCGCPKCNGTPNKGLNGFIEEAIKTHGHKYDYSKSKYKTGKDVITIICPNHGEFEQIAYSHISGQGCPSCGMTRRIESNKKDVNEFIEKAKLVHGCKYDYSKVDYTNSATKVAIICHDHGEFEQTPGSHINQSAGCPSCSNSGPSQAEQLIYELCKGYATDVEQSNRTAIAPKELDIYIPSLKLAIEYNGTYWHSEQFRDKKYHQEKFLRCQAEGIQLFQIWEHDFVDPVKQEIILSMLQYKLGKARRIYARKTKVSEIDYREAKAFYNEHHLQGAGRCHSNQNHYALSADSKLVMVMSVDYRNNYIIRVCTAKGLAVVGGASKLFKSLPCGDYMSYGSNDLGGHLTHYQNARRSITEPRYFWYKNGEIIQRQAVQKHKLPDKYPNFDGSTEVAWMRSIGYHRVFDSGNTKLEFTIRRPNI